MDPATAIINKLGGEAKVACRARCGSNDEPVKIVAALLFDELDREAVGQMSDDAPDTGSDRERHSDPRLHIRRDRGTGS